MNKQKHHIDTAIAQAVLCIEKDKLSASIKISWLPSLLAWITNICIQQDQPRVWNKGSDVNPHALGVLTAFSIILQCNKMAIVSYCAVTQWVLIKSESQQHTMTAINILVNNIIHNTNPFFFMNDLWQLKTKTKELIISGLLITRLIY